MHQSAVPACTSWISFTKLGVAGRGGLAGLSLGQALTFSERDLHGRHALGALPSAETQAQHSPDFNTSFFFPLPSPLPRISATAHGNNASNVNSEHE